MKLKLITYLLLALATSSLFAQQLKVEERKIKNEEGIDMLSWTALLDQNADYCKDSYEAFMKEFFKAKTDKRSKNILVAEKVMIPELSNLRMDQRALFSVETGGTAVSFMFSPGHDIHFSRDMHDEEFAKAESFTKGFVRYHYKRFYNDKLKTIEEKLKSKGSDVASSAKKIDRNNKSIAENSRSGDAKTKNDKLQKEIDVLTEATSKLKDEIGTLEDESAKIKAILEEVEKFR
jgi:uncharacterized phage infection (PIP) family protein YhgE